MLRRGDEGGNTGKTRRREQAFERAKPVTVSSQFGFTGGNKRVAAMVCNSFLMFPVVPDESTYWAESAAEGQNCCPVE
jgi:hypothetical protein